MTTARMLERSSASLRPVLTSQSGSQSPVTMLRASEPPIPPRRRACCSGVSPGVDRSSIVFLFDDDGALAAAVAAGIQRLVGAVVLVVPFARDLEAAAAAPIARIDVCSVRHRSSL